MADTLAVSVVRNANGVHGGIDERRTDDTDVLPDLLRGPEHGDLGKFGGQTEDASPYPHGGGGWQESRGL